MKKSLLFLLAITIFLFSIVAVEAVVYEIQANCTSTPVSSISCNQNLTIYCNITTNVPNGINTVRLHADTTYFLDAPVSGTRIDGTWEYVIGPFTPNDGKPSVYNFDRVFITAHEVGDERLQCNNMYEQNGGDYIGDGCDIDWTPDAGSSITNNCSCDNPVRVEGSCEFDETGTSTLGGYRWINYTVPYSGCPTYSEFQEECVPCEPIIVPYYTACLSSTMTVTYEVTNPECCAQLGDLCNIPASYSLTCLKDSYTYFMEDDQTGVRDQITAAVSGEVSEGQYGFIQDDATFSSRFVHYQYSISTAEGFQPVVEDFDLDGIMNVYLVNEPKTSFSKYTYYQANLTLSDTVTVPGTIAGQFAYNDVYGGFLVPVVNSTSNYVCVYTTKPLLDTLGCVDVGANYSINNSGIICSVDDEKCYIKGNDDGIHYAIMLAVSDSAVTVNSVLALTANSTGGDNIGWDEDNENVPIVGNFYQTTGDNEVVFTVPINSSGTKIYLPIPTTINFDQTFNYQYPPPYILPVEPTSMNGQPIIYSDNSNYGDWAVSQEIGSTLELLRLRVMSPTGSLSIQQGSLTGTTQFESSNDIGGTDRVGNIICKNDVNCFATVFPASCTGRALYTNYACSNYSSYVYEWNGDSWSNTGAYGEYIFEDYDNDYWYGLDRGADAYFRTADGVNFGYFTSTVNYDHLPPKNTWTGYAGQVCDSGTIGSPAKFIDCYNGICYMMAFLNDSNWGVSYSNAYDLNIYKDSLYQKTNHLYAGDGFSGGLIEDVTLLYEEGQVLLFEHTQSVRTFAGNTIRQSKVDVLARNMSGGNYITRWYTNVFPANPPWYYPAYHTATYVDDKLTLGIMHKPSALSNCVPNFYGFDVVGSSSITLVNSITCGYSGFTQWVSLMNVAHDPDEEMIYLTSYCHINTGNANFSSSTGLISLDADDFFSGIDTARIVDTGFIGPYGRVHAGEDFIMYPSTGISRYTKTDLLTTVWDQYMNDESGSYLVDYDQADTYSLYANLPTTVDGSARQLLVYNIDESTDNSKEIIKGSANGLFVYTGSGLLLLDSENPGQLRSELAVCDIDRDSYPEILGVFGTSFKVYSYTTVLVSEDTETVPASEFSNIICKNIDSDANLEAIFKDRYGNVYIYDNGVLSTETDAVSTEVYNENVKSDIVYLEDWSGLKAVAFPILTDYDEIKFWVRDEDGDYYSDTMSWDGSYLRPLVGIWYYSYPTNIDVVSDGQNQVWVSVGTALALTFREFFGEYDDGDKEWISDNTNAGNWPEGKVMGFTNTSSGGVTDIFDKDIGTAAHHDGSRLVKHTQVPHLFYYYASGSCVDGCVGWINAEVDTDLRDTTREVYGYNLYLFEDDDDSNLVQYYVLPTGFGETTDISYPAAGMNGRPIAVDTDGDGDMNVVFGPCFEGIPSNNYRCEDSVLIADLPAATYDRPDWYAAYGHVSPIVVDVNNDGLIDFLGGASSGDIEIYLSSGAGATTQDVNTTIEITRKNVCPACAGGATMTNPILSSLSGEDVYGVCAYAMTNTKNQIYLLDTESLSQVKVLRTNTGMSTGKYLSGFDYNGDDETDYLIPQGIYDPTASFGEDQAATLISGSSDAWMIPVNLDSDEHSDILYVGSAGAFISALPVSTVLTSSENTVQAYCSVVGDDIISVSVMATSLNPDEMKFTFYIDGETYPQNTINIEDIDDDDYIYTFPEISGVAKGDHTATVKMMPKDSNESVAEGTCTFTVVEETQLARCAWVNEFFYSDDLRDKGWVYTGVSTLRPNGEEVPSGEVRLRRHPSASSLYLWRPDIDCYYSAYNIEIGMRMSDLADGRIQMYGEWQDDETRYWDTNLLGYLRFKDGVFYTKDGESEVSKATISTYEDSDDIVRLLFTFNTITETLNVKVSDSQEEFVYDDIDEISDINYNTTLFTVPYIEKVRANAETLHVIPFKELMFMVDEGYVDLLWVHTYARGSLLDGDKFLEIDEGIELLKQCSIFDYCSGEWGESELTGWGKFCDMRQLKEIVSAVPTSYNGSCFNEALDYCTRVTYQVEALDKDEDKLGGKYDFIDEIGTMKEEAVTVCASALSISAAGNKFVLPILGQFWAIFKAQWLITFAVITILIIALPVFFRRKS